MRPRPSRVLLCSRICPPTMRPGLGSMICRIERAVTLLPQPLSPTTQSVLPRRSVKLDVVDRLDDFVPGLEPGAEVLHLEHDVAVPRSRHARFNVIGVGVGGVAQAVAEEVEGEHGDAPPRRRARTARARWRSSGCSAPPAAARPS